MIEVNKSTVLEGKYELYQSAHLHARAFYVSKGLDVVDIVRYLYVVVAFVLRSHGLLLDFIWLPSEPI